MPIFHNDVPTSDDHVEEQERRCACLNRLLIKLAVLNIVINGAIYCAADQGEADSLAEYLLLPLAVVSLIALVGTLVRRVASHVTPS